MAGLFVAYGILITIIWIVIGWRAMRAHEKIASNVTRYFDTFSVGDLHSLRKENAIQNKNYRKYLLQNPDVEKMPSKERHERFRDWLRSTGHLDPEE